MLDKIMATGAGLVILFYLTIVISFIAGWITNVIWLFQNGFQDWQAEVILAVVGIFVAPLGAIHGVYTWF